MADELSFQKKKKKSCYVAMIRSSDMNHEISRWKKNIAYFYSFGYLNFEYFILLNIDWEFMCKFSALWRLQR